jgi:hypothetical protein
MLFIEKLQANASRAAITAISSLYGLAPGRATGYLDKLLANHAEHGPEVWKLLGTLEMRADEQAGILYGCVCGGYLFAKMVEDNDDSTF